MRLSRALFIARKDIAYTLKDKTTLAWLILMPALFFYFIGTATGGFGGGGSDAPDNIAISVPADAGFLSGQLALRLSDSGFNVVTFAADNLEVPVSGGEQDVAFDGYCRRLVIPAGLTRSVQDGDGALLDYSTCTDELNAQFDEVRVQRAVYTTLADIIAASVAGGLNETNIAALNAIERVVTLEVRPAGKKREIPTGFQQAVPGTMVMFTLLVLLTSGAITLYLERTRGVLRRLASAPLSRGEIVFGKWMGKMFLAVIQIGIAMVMGSLLFKVNWQPDFLMIVALLLAWAGACTSFAIVLGSVGRTEGQVSGIGVLSSMLLGGLGGCWWPIEIAPAWMQQLASLLPTGWTMNGLHRLMSFEAGALSALPELMLLVATTAIAGIFAVKSFRFE
ncbi:MAG: ABC transporter permease [Gammaproteobacteria bacterium]|nr:ABC transporter permease [Gammaproteobacteria bacterium]